MSDTIDRHAAIDYFVTNVGFHDEDGYPIEDECELREIWTGYFDGIPSAQPDTYWKEQCQSYEQTINKLRESLSTQPEITRCKNCKHWIPYEWMFSEVWQSKNIADYPEDDIGCDLCDMAMKANDFCSRAERRDDG